MKKTLAIVLAASAVLAGCVVPVYDNPPQRGAYRGDRDRDNSSNRRDRDGDGVPNRYDQAPNNPARN